MTDPPEVYRNDARSSIDRLKNGDSVVVTVRYQEVSSIDATPQSANASGIIQKVTMDTSGTLIEVALSDGGTASYRVSAGVSVTQDGKAVSIDSLKPGYQIAMVLDGDQILSIGVDKSAVSSNQIDGTVLYVNTSSEEMLIQRRGEDQGVITCGRLGRPAPLRDGRRTLSAAVRDQPECDHLRLLRRPDLPGHPGHPDLEHALHGGPRAYRPRGPRLFPQVRLDFWGKSE